MDVVTLSRLQLRELINEAAQRGARIVLTSAMQELTATPPDFLFKDWVTTAEAARLLGRSDSGTVLKLRDQIDHRREGRNILWRRKSIDEYIENCEQE